jgi:phospholipase C
MTFTYGTFRSRIPKPFKHYAHAKNKRREGSLETETATWRWNAMRSLANVCRIARLREPWSAGALAAAYQVAPPISVAELIDHVMGYSSFDKIKRFFVLVLENRSFDHMLGFSQIRGIDAKTGEETDIKGLSDIHAVSDGLEAKECNKDSSGKCWYAAAPTEVALRIDPRHEFENMMQQLGLDGSTGPNEGFVLSMEQKIADAIKDDPDSADAKASPDVVMRSMLPSQVPVLNYLAREYAVCDQWFSSGPLPTIPNRMFLHAASSGGLDNSPSGLTLFSHQVGDGWDFEHGTIFDRLGEAGIDWQVYEGDEFPVSWAFEGVKPGSITDMEDFAGDLFDPDFSYQYVFIEPAYDAIPPSHYEDGNSQHPYNNVTFGEMLIWKIYMILSSSPWWEESAFVILYDEGGGFYDHEPPPQGPPLAVPPGDKVYPERVENNFRFTKLGPRVPAIVVSPWIPRGTIDHTPYDHTSLLKTVERRFGLDPLTDRDANAHDFAHLFRLHTPRDVHQPASGMTGSEGERATGGEATSSPLTIARGDLDETLRHIDAMVASSKRTAIALPPIPPSTPIAELPRTTIGFLQVAFIKESKLRSAAERPAVAERVREVRTAGQALELLDSLKTERGAVRPDARDMVPGIRIAPRRHREL